VLIACVAVLLAIGVVEIYSASAIKSAYSFHDDTLRLRKHLTDITVGLVVLFVMLVMPSRILQRLRAPLIGLTIVMLALVLIPGVGSTQNTGARRWFSIFGQSFQPSELAKYALIIFIASWLAERKDGIRRFHPDFTVPIGLVGLAVFLILMEPSISVAAFVAAICCLMLLIGGTRIRYFIPAAAAVAVVAAIVLGAVMLFGAGDKMMDKFDYAKERILAKLGSGDDAGEKNYQSVQAVYALTNGSWFGCGPGKGKQSLYYLPESDSDFIFAIIAEELGFVGATFVVLLYILLLFSALKIAFAAPDRFSGLLAIGLTMILGLQAFIHIGVVTGALFLTGAPLPFITRGGTAMIFSLAAVGFIIGVAHRSAAETRPPRKSVERTRPKAKPTTVRTKKPVAVKDFTEKKRVVVKDFTESIISRK
jgi:cell division protein FtsW